jgi:hypothetical protein
MIQSFKDFDIKNYKIDLDRFEWVFFSRKKDPQFDEGP